jgi:hypothetical protein
MIDRLAVELLLAQPQTTTSPFFFLANWGDGHFIGIMRARSHVCAGRPRRRQPAYLASYLRERRGRFRLFGFSERTIAALLGHAARGVTQRYVYIDEALRMAADKVSSEIAAIHDDGAGRSRAAERQAVASELALEHASA